MIACVGQDKIMSLAPPHQHSEIAVSTNDPLNLHSKDHSVTGDFLPNSEVPD